MKITVNNTKHDIPVWLFIPIALYISYELYTSFQVEVVHAEPLDCILIMESNNQMYKHDTQKYTIDTYTKATYEAGGNVLFLQRDGSYIKYKSYKC